MTEIRYVAGVSWPRSGHHLIQRLLQRYFGKSFVYCDFYPEDRDCCRSFPCTKGTVAFSKNHDFGSSAKPVAGVPYLIQYRGLIPSTISDFELYVRNGRSDTPESFEIFARSKAIAWADFVAKWVDAPDDLERFVVPYEDLVRDPVGMLKRTVSFFAPDLQPDEQKIKAIVESEQLQVVTKDNIEWRQRAGIKAFRKVEEFRFYDPDLIADLENMAAERRAALSG